MGMTMTQKILAAHAGLDRVEPGQLIEADLDLVLGNDITAPVAIGEMDKFRKKGFSTIRRSHSFRIISFRPRTSSRPKTASVSASSQNATGSRIISRSERWELNMPCCRRRA